MKNVLFRPSKESSSISNVFREVFAFFSEIESVSLKIEADNEGVTNSSMSGSVISFLFVYVASFSSSVETFQSSFPQWIAR